MFAVDDFGFWRIHKTAQQCELQRGCMDLPVFSFLPGNMFQFSGSEMTPMLLMSVSRTVEKCHNIQT